MSSEYDETFSNYSQHVSFDLRNTINNNNYEFHLNKCLTKEQIEQIKNLFYQNPKKQLNYQQLRTILSNFDINFTNYEYQLLWTKINGFNHNNNDNQITTWYDFISYLDLEYRTYNPINDDDLNLPLQKNSIKIQLSKHKRKIIGITFYYSNFVEITVRKRKKIS